MDNSQQHFLAARVERRDLHREVLVRRLAVRATARVVLSIVRSLIKDHTEEIVKDEVGVVAPVWAVRDRDDNGDVIGRRQGVLPRIKNDEYL